MKDYTKWYCRIILLSVIINFMIEVLGRKSLSGAAVYLLASPLVFLLNTVIILFLFNLVFITKRKVFICVLCSILWLGMGSVNGVLLTFRTTPFTAADLRLLKYGLNMITTYMNWFQIIAVAGAVCAALVGCVILWRKAPLDGGKVNYAAGAAIVLLTLGGAVGITNIGMRTGLVAVRFGNINQAFKEYGFPYGFSNSLFNTGIAKPVDYDSEKIEMIEAQELIQENVYGLDENKTPNIIFIQLESFFDPELWNNNPMEEDPIPFFRYLTKTYPSGFLSVPSVGAGTANTEFEVITGMNLDFFGPGEYPYKTILKKTSCESMAFDLKKLGYTAHAIHNNEATFYDRNRVFSQLGFDTFTPIEYMYRIERNPIGWCRDKVLVDEIIKTLDSTAGSDYIYTISVQGHGAYPDFPYYCSQIGEMDEFVKQLLRTLNSRKEPAVVVLYGDHLPGFEWEAEEMANKSLYQTKYVIWNNMNIPRQKMNMEAYQLSAYVLDLLGIHEGTMMRFHQNYMNTPDDRQSEAEYLEAMKTLEYDILYGNHEIYGGQMPFEATELQMGVVPVSVERIVYDPPNLLIYGKNFNEFSKICINDKALDTMYVWPELIIARDIPEKKMDKPEITVKQIGRDKVPLGTAEMGMGFSLKRYGGREQ